MRVNITSAAGIIALLDEPEQEIKNFALQKLDHIVNEFWAEISEAVDKMWVKLLCIFPCYFPLFIEINKHIYLCMLH